MLGPVGPYQSAHCYTKGHFVLENIPVETGWFTTSQSPLIYFITPEKLRLV